MDRGAWRATVHGVAQSQTRLSLHAQHAQPGGRGKGLDACPKADSPRTATSVSQSFYWRREEAPCRKSSQL